MPCPAELKRCLGRAGHRSCCNSIPVLHVWPRHFSAQIASKLMPWPAVPSPISHHYPSPSHKRSHKGTKGITHGGIGGASPASPDACEALVKYKRIHADALLGHLWWAELGGSFESSQGRWDHCLRGSDSLHCSVAASVTQVWRKCDAFGRWEAMGRWRKFQNSVTSQFENFKRYGTISQRRSCWRRRGLCGRRCRFTCSMCWQQQWWDGRIW